MNDSDDDSEQETTKTTIFLKVAEGRNFPITDAISSSSDPYCVVKVSFWCLRICFSSHLGWGWVCIINP